MTNFTKKNFPKLKLSCALLSYSLGHMEMSEKKGQVTTNSHTILP